MKTYIDEMRWSCSEVHQNPLVYIHVVVLFKLLVNVITFLRTCLSGQILTKSNYLSLFHL